MCKCCLMNLLVFNLVLMEYNDCFVMYICMYMIGKVGYEIKLYKKIIEYLFYYINYFFYFNKMCYINLLLR